MGRSNSSCFVRKVARIGQAALGLSRCPEISLRQSEIVSRCFADLPRHLVAEKGGFLRRQILESVLVLSTGQSVHRVDHCSKLLFQRGILRAGGFGVQYTFRQGSSLSSTGNSKSAGRSTNVLRSEPRVLVSFTVDRIFCRKWCAKEIFDSTSNPALCLAVGGLPNLLARLWQKDLRYH